MVLTKRNAFCISNHELWMIKFNTEREVLDVLRYCHHELYLEQRTSSCCVRAAFFFCCCLLPIFHDSYFNGQGRRYYKAGIHSQAG